MSAGAVLVIRQNRYMRALRDVGATDASSAVPLERLDLRDSVIFRGLVMRGVVQSADGGRYWLDEGAAEAFLRRRRMRMLAAAIIALGVVLVVLIKD